MDIVSNKSYENEFYNLENYRTKPIRGILIYEDAQKKLDIGENGKLYRQKWYNYIPLLGPIFATIYANFVLAKTKCLRNRDMLLFRNVNKSVNIFAILIWPLLFLMLWTLLTYISVDFAYKSSFMLNFPGSVIPNVNVSIGNNGDYYNLWQCALVNQLSTITVNSANSFFRYLAVLFSGLFYIFIFPLITHGSYVINSCVIPTNLIFISSFILITIINPVNIFNTLLINASKLRFVIVYEASSIYRYRSR